MEGMSAEEKKWGPETETAWRALFDTATDKKKQPMAELVGGMQRLLKECTNALRQELGDKPFVVISGN
jgi:protoporphyrinogen oxidase